MPLRLQRVSLIDQVSARLRECLARGDWPQWLPSERRLCLELGVGRNSLRAALRRLSDEGVLEVRPGFGHRNTGRMPSQYRPDDRVVALLSPLRLDELRPKQALWIDELRGILAESGCRLRIIHHPRPARISPAPALQRLVERERPGCWILVRSNQAVQAWFARQRLSCVIAGSCHEGVDLPFVDLDYRAMCRHAATTLLRAGHRRIAYLTQKPDSAGDLRSEEGFLEGVKGFGAPEAKAGVVHHEADRTSVALAVRRVMSGPRPPTALFINQSYHYLTTCSVLAELGLRVPREVSLLCRDEDRFLDYLVPEPARYVEDSHLFARKLARITETLMRERPAKPPRVLLIPRLGPGASIGRWSGEG